MKEKLLSLFALLLMIVTGAWAEDMKKVPLTLEAKTAGTIVVSSPQSGMKYSKNGGEKTTVPASITVAIGDKVSFYGNGTSIISYYDTKITGGTADCYIYGNIMSLVDESGFATATTLTEDLPVSANFSQLFQDNTHLYNHASKDLVLPATTLTSACYANMFNGCTNLTTAPELPATTLTSTCYASMFQGCTNLTTAPELPATTLANNCYQLMFYGCTSLTAAPELPATTLAGFCYDGMFQGCTNLKTAPELPAPTLVNYCYRSMFNGCTKLNSVTCLATDISASYATSSWLDGVAVTGTFFKAYGMTGWTTGIPSRWTVDDDIMTVPLTLEAKTAGTIVVSNPKSGMQYSLNGGAKTAVTSTDINVTAGQTVAFYGNGTSITSYYGTNIAGGTADCYIYGNIMSLVDENGYATATTLKGENAFRELFNNNGKLYNHASKDLVLPATTLTNSCYRGMFNGCSNLTSAPALPATTLTSSCYDWMFYGCSSLNSAPALPATTLASSCYDSMFEGCTGLTTAPELPATTLENNCYHSMFEGCTGLTTAPALPATTLVINCYQGMFSGCTALTSAPDLPATTLANSCYNGMFNGCSSLNSVTCLATDISADYATTDWLYGVAKTGTFNRAYGMTSWTAGASGIPSGWTVENNIKTVPLTLEAKTTGTIVVSNPKSGMQYSLNGGGKADVTSEPIAVTAGQTVAFYGKGTSIPSYGYDLIYTKITDGTADCYIYGNIMSLVDETGYATATTLTGALAFSFLFQGNTHLYNHASKDLVLPATTLTSGCYGGMFQGCTNLTTAPKLPATTLLNNCYQDMFSGCTNLNSITCFATDISAEFATSNWLKDVAATGTFTKATSTDWGARGVSTIPTGWTIVNNDPITLTDGDDLSSLTPCADQVCTVNYTRTFTADKPSTVCLPFDYAVKTGEKFYEFTGITKNGDEYVATMTLYSGPNLVANTPYLYKSTTTGATDFSGTYTLPAEITAGTTTSGEWKFVGTYTTQSWTSAPKGIYGFSATATGDISQGEFVKVGAYVRVKPMRCYLKYKNGAEDYSAARSFSDVPNTLSEPLPEKIKVRFVDANGEVTSIGCLNTHTGEVSFDNKAWYTLDGVRLNAQPTQKGIYVNNGKKVVVK